MHFRCGKHENGMGWGLFEGFQQGIKGGIGEHVHFIDNVNAVGPPEGGKLHIFSKLSNIIHTGIGGAINFYNIH